MIIILKTKSNEQKIIDTDYDRWLYLKSLILIVSTVVVVGLFFLSGCLPNISACNIKDANMDVLRPLIIIMPVLSTILGLSSWRNLRKDEQTKISFSKNEMKVANESYNMKDLFFKVKPDSLLLLKHIWKETPKVVVLHQGNEVLHFHMTEKTLPIFKKAMKEEFDIEIT